MNRAADTEGGDAMKTGPLALLTSAFLIGGIFAAAAQPVTGRRISGPAAAGDYTISFPRGFVESEMNPPEASTDWRWDQSEPGVILQKIGIPASFEPHTNFNGATLTIGRSADPKAIADCTANDPAADKIARAKINGVDFAVVSGSDAGMSHNHDITSYRTLHGGRCYAIEYSIGSTSLGVYDPSMGLKAFDEARVKAILERIVATFRFR